MKIQRRRGGDAKKRRHDAHLARRIYNKSNKSDPFQTHASKLPQLKCRCLSHSTESTNIFPAVTAPCRDVMRFVWICTAELALAGAAKSKSLIQFACVGARKAKKGWIGREEVYVLK